MANTNRKNLRGHNLNDEMDLKSVCLKVQMNLQCEHSDQLDPRIYYVTDLTEYSLIINHLKLYMSSGANTWNPLRSGMFDPTLVE